MDSSSPAHRQERHRLQPRHLALSPVDRGTIISELLAAANTKGITGVRQGILTASSTTVRRRMDSRSSARPSPSSAPPSTGPTGASAHRIHRRLLRRARRSRRHRRRSRPTPASSTATASSTSAATGAPSPSRTPPIGVTASRPASPTTPSGTVLQRDDAASAARGLLETVVSTDLTVDALRDALLAAHIAARAGPRQTITFTPIRALGRVPRLGIDYDVGDVVPFRATVNRDDVLVKRLDVLVRVYSYAVTIDDAGYGTPTLTVVPSIGGPAPCLSTPRPPTQRRPTAASPIASPTSSAASAASREVHPSSRSAPARPRAPRDGTPYGDSTAVRLYLRVGGTWRYTTLT